MMSYNQNEHSIDKGLIDAIKRGENHAFDILVLRYQSRVQRIIGRYIHDPSEGLDVCQEVFIKVYHALKNFRGDSSFYTWLYRITVNTSKNYLISQGRRARDVNFTLQEDMERFLIKNTPKDTGTPEHLLMRDELQDVVYDTIEHLPKELRLAIKLRELEGLTYEEIASVMDCPVGTVRSRIFRARAVIDRSVDPFLLN